MSVSIDPSLLGWVKQRAGPGRTFANVSHALERGIVCLQDHETETPTRRR